VAKTKAMKAWLLLRAISWGSKESRLRGCEQFHGTVNKVDTGLCSGVSNFMGQ
jgi:hypothetical protein